MPLVADFTGLIASFTNADLDPLTLERWVPGVTRRGTVIKDGATNRYQDEGLLTPCFVVPSGAGERGEVLPAGERAREAITFYCRAEVRGERHPSGQPDVVRRDDGRRYQVTSVKPWGRSGAFWEATAELLDE